MQAALADVEPDQGAVNLVWLAQVNRYFHLAEPLRETAKRRWWDILAFRLAMTLEAELSKPEGIA